MLSRRDFLATTAASVTLPATYSSPLRLTIVATVYRYLSHAQHIGDRFLVGYPCDGAWHRPHIQVVSLYVDQKSDGDLSDERAREFGFPVYPSISEALCCGGSQLACDAVLVIAEHGDYPGNDKGQKLYPRFEFFEQCRAVFETSGRAVPLYNDKHLSYSFDKAKKMVAASRRLRFPLMAGSSLPVTWRLPSLQIPLGARVDEALMIGFGGSDAMDFHALEAMQCMLERRQGGESGVRSVQLLDGDAVWNADWSRKLLCAALSRSDTPLGLTLQDGRTQDLSAPGLLQALVKHPAAYLLEYRDGLRATLLMLEGAIKDFTFAARLNDSSIVSTQFLLTPEPNVTYSARLVSKMENMFVTGRAPYPVERTLLTSGILESCLESRKRNNVHLETPHLKVEYAVAESQLA